MAEQIEIVTDVPVMKERPSDSHKGIFGKVCIIGGSLGMSGAAAIAGKAALRSGAGLVRVATAESVLGVVAATEPSYTTIGLADDSKGRIAGKAVNMVEGLIEDNDAFAFGPGVGVSASVKKFLEKLISYDIRVVIDADGLNNLSGINGWEKKCRAKMIVTPHPGEMKRLWKGLFREPISTERIEQAVKMSRRTGCVVVLKGSGTVVSDGNSVYVNTTGNPGMATAGSGDSLTGIITALLGQGLEEFEAAVLGVYVHGMAGDLAAEKFGQISMIATDILDMLGKAFKSLGR